jgi:PAS domain S-box-containing protein
LSTLPATVAPDTRSLPVLLLEDSRFDAELLREALHAAYPNATLQVVRDEQGFAQALARGGWGMILSDYEIPGFSGEQALAMARSVAPEVPFIFVSGVIGEDNAVEMLKRGATDYVSKSRLSRLPLVMERALREAGGRAALGRVQTQLREAADVYERVVNTLRNYAVILTDKSGRITSWNIAAGDIFGHARERMIGQPVELLFTPEDRERGVPQQEMREALSRGLADDDRWLLRSDGLRLWAEGVVTPLFNDRHEHSGFCKVVRDATTDYRDAEALRAAKEQAERASEVKDRFLAILSHELRTPLTPIATAAHLLEKTASVPDKYRDLLPMIRRNVALEARMIDDLLDLTAISTGKVTLKLEQVDMHHLVNAVADMLAEQVRNGGLQLKLELQAASPLVHADPARMQQVLWNLMRNAVKFTSRGGRITVRTRSDRRQFTLECSDTGIGIEPKALPSIFNAFEQADHEVTRKFGGLGLGLAIARGLVLQHDGELSAHSDGRDHGATFTLKLPLAVQADDTLPGDSGASDASDVDALQVLLVEDNIDAAETMQMLLEAYGWRVTHAATCAAALAIAKKHEFDVVLTDLGLPDGSGIDVGRQLSARLPVVALSGYGAAPDLRNSAMAGFAEHLIKPAEPAVVHQTLKKAIAERAARQAVRS